MKHMILIATLSVLTSSPATAVAQETALGSFLAASETDRQQILKKFDRPMSDGLVGDPLPLVETGLQDPSGQVRYLSASVLFRIVSEASESLRAGRQVAVDPGGSPTLVQVVSHSLNDAEVPLVRAASVKTLVFLSEHSDSGASLRTAVVERYQAETDHQVRRVIVDELSRHLESAGVQRLMIAAALYDPSPMVRAAAAVPASLSRSPIVLPRIVAELKSGGLDTRSQFVRALTNYGAQAKEYIPLLEELLKTERYSGSIADLRYAIQLLRTAR